MDENDLTRSPLLLSIALCLCLSGCSRAMLMKKITPPEDEVFARKYVNLLRQREFDQVEQKLDPSIAGSDVRNTLDKMAEMFPDGEPKFGFPNINDNAEIAELIACGSHVILFTTGRGSVVGSAISPVIKICANPETYERMSDDMDVNAGKILRLEASVDEVGEEIYKKVLEVASGTQSCSESLGHQEFVLTYKSFEPIGPACLPM